MPEVQYPSKAYALSQIVEQTLTDDVNTLSADGWLVGLPELDAVACRFTMEDSLSPSYLWWDGEAYRASGLGAGLEWMEGRPLNRHEAGGLLEGAVSLEPVVGRRFDDE